MLHSYFVLCKVYFENNIVDLYSSVYNIDEKITTSEVFQRVENHIKEDVKVTTENGSVFKANRIIILDFKLL